jgi:hypothetical protein
LYLLGCSSLNGEMHYQSQKYIINPQERHLDSIAPGRGKKPDLGWLFSSRLCKTKQTATSGIRRLKKYRRVLIYET